MKVSVIAYCFPDYMMEILSDGLIRLLGRENIHFQFNEAFPPDCMRAQIYQLLKQPNRFDLYDGDALIISTRSGINRLSDWISRTGKSHVAVIDGEDDMTIRNDFRVASRVYFKREIALNTQFPGVRPLLFGAIPEPIPTVERTRKVAFLGKVTSQARQEIWNVLSSLGLPAQEPLRAKEKYNEALASSLVGISVRGAGWDTYRHWENAYFGCAPLCERPKIQVPENFVDGKEAIFFDGIQDFQIKLQFLLSDPERTKAIGAVAQKACQGRHLSTHRAKTVLEAIS